MLIRSSHFDSDERGPLELLSGGAERYHMMPTGDLHPGANVGMITAYSGAASLSSVTLGPEEYGYNEVMTTRKPIGNE